MTRTDLLDLAERVDIPRIYLDLDGVMADFDAHFPETFGLDHKSLADDEMWAKINSHPSYFRDLPPCLGAIEFFRSIEFLQPIILTACPRTNYAHAAKQKREWVREHLSEKAMVLPVMGGHNKPLFMHEPGDVLIDDFAKNIDAWDKAGGIGILHSAFETTSARLAALLRAYAETAKVVEAEASKIMGDTNWAPHIRAGVKLLRDELRLQLRALIEESP